MLKKRLLHRVQSVARGQALNRGDLVAIVADRKCQAAVDPAALDQNRAGSALAMVATFFVAVNCRSSRSRSSRLVRGSIANCQLRH